MIQWPVSDKSFTIPEGEPLVCITTDSYETLKKNKFQSEKEQCISAQVPKT
jgi:hypothetical protein